MPLAGERTVVFQRLPTGLRENSTATIVNADAAAM